MTQNSPTSAPTDIISVKTAARFLSELDTKFSELDTKFGTNTSSRNSPVLQEIKSLGLQIEAVADLVVDDPGTLDLVRSDIKLAFTKLGEIMLSPEMVRPIAFLSVAQRLTDRAMQVLFPDGIPSQEKSAAKGKDEVPKVIAAEPISDQLIKPVPSLQLLREQLAASNELSPNADLQATQIPPTPRTTPPPAAMPLTIENSAAIGEKASSTVKKAQMEVPTIPTSVAAPSVPTPVPPPPSPSPAEPPRKATISPTLSAPEPASVTPQKLEVPAVKLESKPAPGFDQLIQKHIKGDPKESSLLKMIAALTDIDLRFGSIRFGQTSDRAYQLGIPAKDIADCFQILTKFPDFLVRLNDSGSKAQEFKATPALIEFAQKHPLSIQPKEDSVVRATRELADYRMLERTFNLIEAEVNRLAHQQRRHPSTILIFRNRIEPALKEQVGQEAGNCISILVAMGMLAIREQGKSLVLTNLAQDVSAKMMRLDEKTASVVENLPPTAESSTKAKAPPPLPNGKLITSAPVGGAPAQPQKIFRVPEELPVRLLEHDARALLALVFEGGNESAPKSLLVGSIQTLFRNEPSDKVIAGLVFDKLIRLDRENVYLSPEGKKVIEDQKNPLVVIQAEDEKAPPASKLSKPTDGALELAKIRLSQEVMELLLNTKSDDRKNSKVLATELKISLPEVLPTLVALQRLGLLAGVEHSSKNPSLKNWFPTLKAKDFDINSISTARAWLESEASAKQTAAAAKEVKVATVALAAPQSDTTRMPQLVTSPVVSARFIPNELPQTDAEFVDLLVKVGCDEAWSEEFQFSSYNEVSLLELNSRYTSWREICQQTNVPDKIIAQIIAKPQFWENMSCAESYQLIGDFQNLCSKPPVERIEVDLVEFMTKENDDGVEEIDSDENEQPDPTQRKNARAELTEKVTELFSQYREIDDPKLAAHICVYSFHHNGRFAEMGADTAITHLICQKVQSKCNPAPSDSTVMECLKDLARNEIVLPIEKNGAVKYRLNSIRGNTNHGDEYIREALMLISSHYNNLN